jgi:hypothetical protein
MTSSSKAQAVGGTHPLVTDAGRQRTGRRELQARLDAERSTARAHLVVTERPERWATAAPEQIAGVWKTARRQDLNRDTRAAADRCSTTVQPSRYTTPRGREALPHAARSLRRQRDPRCRTAQTLYWSRSRTRTGTSRNGTYGLSGLTASSLGTSHRRVA